jgi:glycosyltransferase involved in cell wall biosynthesis
MKVMIVSTVGLIYDGITSVILSYLQFMELSDIEIYIAGTIKVETSIRKKLEEQGFKIVDFPSRRKNTFNYFFSLVKFLRQNHINVIHAHGNSGTLAIEMLAGWLGGCSNRIAHSHNTRCDQVMADKMLRPIFYLNYTKAVACGVEAGKWLFNNKPFIVLANGRNIDNFAFNSVTRDAVRNQYGISYELAIGHVGGFFEQKNHKFLLEVYRAILQQEPTAKLFMIGDGPLKEKMELDATDIMQNVIFTGTTDRVADYLQAMDGMLLPSLFEGFPLVALEWQINGLPCLLADTITKDCAITDAVEFMSLNERASVWATRIIDKARNNNREERAKIGILKMQEAGFDIRDSSAILKKIYLEG